MGRYIHSETKVSDSFRQFIAVIRCIQQVSVEDIKHTIVAMVPLLRATS